jgi:hypothetical protein
LTLATERPSRIGMTMPSRRASLATRSL